MYNIVNKWDSVILNLCPYASLITANLYNSYNIMAVLLQPMSINER